MRYTDLKFTSAIILCSLELLKRKETKKLKVILQIAPQDLRESIFQLSLIEYHNFQLVEHYIEEYGAMVAGKHVSFWFKVALLHRQDGLVAGEDDNGVLDECRLIRNGPNLPPSLDAGVVEPEP